MEAFGGLVAAGVLAVCLVVLGLVPFGISVVTGVVNVIRPNASSRRWGAASGAITVAFGALVLALESLVSPQPEVRSLAIAGMYAVAGIGAMVSAAIARPKAGPGRF